MAGPMIISKAPVVFIIRFLARSALIGARRCSSAKRRAAFTSMADSDPGHRKARVHPDQPAQQAVTRSEYTIRMILVFESHHHRGRAQPVCLHKCPVDSRFC